MIKSKITLLNRILKLRILQLQIIADSDRGLLPGRYEQWLKIATSTT